MSNGCAFVNCDCALRDVCQTLDSKSKSDPSKYMQRSSLWTRKDPIPIQLSPSPTTTSIDTYEEGSIFNGVKRGKWFFPKWDVKIEFR